MCIYIALVVTSLYIKPCVYCRDAVNEMALHFLAKMKILVVRDIEREDIEFICKVRITQGGREGGRDGASLC